MNKRGFTLVEIMIVVAIIALLAAIAIPNVLRGRTTANESAAIGNMRALVSSLEMYRSVNNAYPTVAQTWAGTMYGVTPAYGPPSFSAELTTGQVIQGFTYTYTDAPTAGQTYNLLATPAAVGTTGTRSLYTNENGLIRHCSEIGAGVSGTAANGRLGVAPWTTIDQALAVPPVDCN